MQLDLAATLRAIVTAGSATMLATTLTNRIAASRSIALARVWLTTAAGSLDLVASAGTPSGGGSYSRLDADFREMAVSDTAITRIAATRESLVVRAIRGDEEWLINPGWAARQGVRAFIGLPLVADLRAVGVVAAFDRDALGDTSLGDLQLVVDIAAARGAELLTGVAAPAPAAPSPSPPAALAIVTRAELRALERASIEAALARANGKIFGAGGAAALLGMRPTTLASRIKALGIR